MLNCKTAPTLTRESQYDRRMTAHGSPNNALSFDGRKFPQESAIIKHVPYPGKAQGAEALFANYTRKKKQKWV